MKLKDVLSGIDVRIIQGFDEMEIKGISYDSRRVGPGHIFVCISGFKSDGHDFVQQAIAAGAAAILAERELELPGEIALILSTDNRRNLPRLASNFYGRPSSDLRLIGVTGTNGKTTTTHLIKYMLEEAGHKSAIIGTLYASVGDMKKNISNTTPESLDIEDFLYFSRTQGADYAVMEVSSHAAELGRVECLDFKAGVLTNLTQDHLDFHGDMENYKIAKQKFFMLIPNEPGRYAIINADDPYAPDFKAVCAVPVISYGIHSPADVRATNIRSSLQETEFDLSCSLGTFSIRTSMIGAFSIYNALAAIATVIQEGIGIDVIQRVMAGTSGVAGRFEQVNLGQDFTVVVDYAHTPDGLENILRTGKEVVTNRLITVFGCGGDRDRTKRPKMGRIAADYSDYCIVTSDNPRSEEPPAIISEIVAGMQGVPDNRLIEIVDRADAIKYAIGMAAAGDLVVIAGKGHETYQLVKDKVLDFDDREVAAKFIRERLNNAM